MNSSTQPSVKWHRTALIIAALQCWLWGALILIAPQKAATIYGFDRPIADEYLWKGTGLVIFLYGVGYAIASLDPMRHWSVIVPGFAAKILGPMGMAMSVYSGEVPARVLILIPLNDLIWWIPFALILRSAFHNIRSDL